MTNVEFKYWIQGFYQLSGQHVLDEKQVRIIHNHADLVKRTEGRLDHSIQYFLDQLRPHQAIFVAIQTLVDTL